MIAFEFYVYDEMEEFHSVGILPERRKNLLRKTQETVMKQGKIVAGDDLDVNNFYFVQIEI